MLVQKWVQYLLHMQNKNVSNAVQNYKQLMVASGLQWVLSYTQSWIVTHISTVDDIKNPDAITTPLGLFLRMQFGYEMQLKHSVTKSRMVYTFAMPTLMTYSLPN